VHEERYQPLSDTASETRFSVILTPEEAERLFNSPMPDDEVGETRQHHHGNGAFDEGQTDGYPDLLLKPLSRSTVSGGINPHSLPHTGVPSVAESSTTPTNMTASPFNRYPQHPGPVASPFPAPFPSEPVVNQYPDHNYSPDPYQYDNDYSNDNPVYAFFSSLPGQNTDNHETYVPPSNSKPMYRPPTPDQEESYGPFNHMVLHREEWERVEVWRPGVGVVSVNGVPAEDAERRARTTAMGMGMGMGRGLPGCEYTQRERARDAGSTGRTYYSSPYVQARSGH
jgi:hypothetical protein